MIVSLRSMSYQELKEKLSRDDRIVLMSCDMCVRYCGFGGIDRLTILEDLLKGDGYNVIRKELVGVSCAMGLIRNRTRDPDKKAAFEEATAIVLIACDEGYETVRRVFRKKKVIPVTKAVGVGNYTEDRGAVLVNPFEFTGLEPKAEGYTLEEAAGKLGMYHTFFDADQKPRLETVEITVDGRRYRVKKGSNLIDACAGLGIYIPHLCYSRKLSPSGACRMCLVKVSGRLTAACTTRVEEGMEVVTEDGELREMRRQILELMLSEHEHSCLMCGEERGPHGECELYRLVRYLGVRDVRYPVNRVRLQVDDSSPVIVRDPNRCILCGRCVRACAEISGQRVLDFGFRGHRRTLIAELNQPLGESDQCAGCLACVFVCPTGALTERIMHFEGEKWVPERAYSCSVGEDEVL
ncbi:hypothetical protein DRJ54_07170 [Candidatus Acetothermia bacterium]|nr:MAG: hypothetical protein DRJ54_07170 [Candidatus Acetothermia bacterium]